tara:strand:+ start:643 stop:1719 length:1077 start_codon:yes stop_codon:yes gene_type:complete
MKVCILGNNLTALTLAKAIVKQNIHVDLLTQKKVLNLNKSRTIGISKSNLDFFNSNIINVEKLIWKLKKIDIFTDNLKNEKLINFEKSNDQLFSIIKNFELYKALEKDLSENKFFKKKISRNNFSFINNYEIIINCDYSHPVTKKYFSKKIVKEYNSFAYTTIIHHEKILNDTATQIFTNKGPLAFLPISNDETSVVFSLHNSTKNNKENIEDLINFYNFKYKINKFEKIDKFKLISVYLRSYYHKNILAFGDLLHRIHPLAGQGFNMTIRDIKMLFKLIKNKYDLGLPLDISVNEQFENNLKYKNFFFSYGIDFIHEFFNMERKSKSNILSKSVKFMGNNPSINKIFTKIADEGSLF